MRKMVVSSVAAASILGATAGLTLGPAIAGAQESEEPSVQATTVAEVLDSLVDDGTLTQAQRDAVQSALEEARPLGPRFGERGAGHRGGLHGAGEILEELGLDRATVREGLAAGMTLGEIAAANGSSSAALTDALTDAANARIDEALESGRIDDDKAEELRARIATRVEGIVDGDARLGRGSGPHRPQAADEDPGA